MIKRATCKTWAEYFEKREGVRVSPNTIHNRLKEAGKIGETARNKVGRVLKSAYFSEQDVRSACADLLDTSLPVCGSDGFAVVAGIRHGTVFTFARLFAIPEKMDTVRSRLASSGLVPVRGRARSGNLVDLYPEPAVRELLKGILDPSLPVCGPDGLVDIRGLRHGTIPALARLLRVSDPTISSRLASSGLAPVWGRAQNGNRVDLFPEPAVRELLKGLLDTSLPVCGSDGFAVVAGIRHGTIPALARLLGVSNRAISRRLAPSSGPAPVRGKDKMGHFAKLYPEPAVRELCKDLIEKQNSKFEIGKSKSKPSK